jgi:hypothetical protein
MMMQTTTTNILCEQWIQLNFLLPQSSAPGQSINEKVLTPKLKMFIPKSAESCPDARLHSLDLGPIRQRQWSDRTTSLPAMV